VPAVVGVPVTAPVAAATDRPGGRVPPSDQVTTAVEDVSVADDVTGLMAVPDTLDWAPGPVAVTVLVTTHVKLSVAE
jgi:hypothetical protein